MPDQRSGTAQLSRSVEATRAYIDTLAEVVRLRLDAGAHPEDAMMTGWALMAAWVAVHVDGSSTSTFGDKGCPRA